MAVAIREGLRFRVLVRYIDKLSHTNANCFLMSSGKSDGDGVIKDGRVATYQSDGPISSTRGSSALHKEKC